MNKKNVVQWQYRTILFEFQKDGLLGDKYIDDEEVEATLNEQGEMGWELVNVTMIQEGLLAFCKRIAPGSASSFGQHSVPTTVSENVEVGRKVQGNVSAETLMQEEREHIQKLEEQRRETMSAFQRDIIGEIKIS